MMMFDGQSKFLWKKEVSENTSIPGMNCDMANEIPYYYYYYLLLFIIQPFCTVLFIISQILFSRISKNCEKSESYWPRKFQAIYT